MADKGLKVNFAFQDEHFVMSADRVRETMDQLTGKISHLPPATRNVFNNHQHQIDKNLAYGVDYAKIYKPGGFLEDFDIDYNRIAISGANPWVQNIIKEKKMNARKMLKPAKQIARRDLITAAEVLDVGYIDGLLDAVAIVQGLKEGETLTRAQNLTLEHVGSRIRVIGGDQGVLSDLRPWSRDNGNYKVSTVIAGRLVELERDDYVVLNAEYVAGGYIKRPNASDH